MEVDGLGAPPRGSTPRSDTIDGASAVGPPAAGPEGGGRGGTGVRALVTAGTADPTTSAVALDPPR